jgi:hypothetical protein
VSDGNNFLIFLIFIFITIIINLKNTNCRPQFYEEIKVRLPGVLTEKHHLLFTVSNGTNEVIGYSYCPVYSSSHG